MDQPVRTQWATAIAPSRSRLRLTQRNPKPSRDGVPSGPGAIAGRASILEEEAGRRPASLLGWLEDELGGHLDDADGVAATHAGDLTEIPRTETGSGAAELWFVERVEPLRSELTVEAGFMTEAEVLEQREVAGGDTRVIYVGQRSGQVAQCVVRRLRERVGIEPFGNRRVGYGGALAGAVEAVASADSVVIRPSGAADDNRCARLDGHNTVELPAAHDAVDDAGWAVDKRLALAEGKVVDRAGDKARRNVLGIHRPLVADIVGIQRAAAGRAQEAHGRICVGQGLRESVSHQQGQPVRETLV